MDADLGELGRRRRRGGGGTAFSPLALFASGEQGVWYDPSDLTPEKTSWRRNLLTYSQDFENAAWTKSNASLLSNLALYSQDFDNAGWIKTNATVTANSSAAPDSTTTGDTLTESAITGVHCVSRTNTYTANAFTLSVYAKQSVGSRNVGLRMWDGTNSYGYAFNLSSGTGVGNTSGDTTPSAFSITSVGNGWYRITISQTLLAGAGDYVISMTSGQVLNYAGDGTSAVLFWGAQLVVGSTAQTYTRSLATAAPVMFSDPLGGTMADKSVSATTTSQQRFSFDDQSTFTASTYTLSVYAKAAEWNFIGLTLFDTAYYGAVFSLTDGTTSFVQSGTTTTATAVGNGWWRLSITANTTGTLSQASDVSGFWPRPSVPTVNIQQSITGDGVSGVYLFGAQLERASTASAYQRITDFNSDFLAAFPTHALYQDYSTTTGGAKTPVTALGQSVAFVVDKRLGGLSALGAEKVSNGNFANGTTGWSWTSSTIAVNNGELEISSTALGGRAEQSLTLETGKWYQVTAIVRNGSATTVGISLVRGPAGSYATLGDQTISAYGTFAISFLAYATGTDALVQAKAGSAGTIFVDNISVREVPGNHAVQATSASRPTLQARANLLTYSEQFDNAAWTKTNVTVTANSVTAPDGTTTADTIAATASASTSLSQTATSVAATAVTFSFYGKQGSGATDANTFDIYNVTTASDLAIFTVNWTTGVVTVTSGSATTTSTNAGNGWWRITATVSSGITSGNNVRVYTAFAGATETASEYCYLWGTQLEAGTTASTYQRVVTATDYADVGLPRSLQFDGTDDSLATVGNVDFATWTGSEARRNLLTMPTMFDDAAWSKTQATITANTTTAPDGTTTADKVVESTTASTVHYVYQTPTLSAVQYTLSIYAKASERSIVMLNTFASATNYYAYFNLSSGTVGTTLNCTARIADAGNGWYRCSMTFTPAAGASDMGARPCIVDGNSSYTGDGTSGLFLWGAQLETGSTATAFQNVGVSAVTGFFGVTKNSDATVGAVTEIGASTDANYASLLNAPRGAATANYGATMRSTAQTFDVTSASSYAAPITNVVTAALNYNGTTNATRGLLRVNTSEAGVSYASATPVGTFTNALVYVGRRSNGTVPFNGRIFQLIVRGAATDSVTVTNAEQYVAQKTGVTL